MQLHRKASAIFKCVLDKPFNFILILQISAISFSIVIVCVSCIFLLTTPQFALECSILRLHVLFCILKTFPNHFHLLFLSSLLMLICHVGNLRICYIMFPLLHYLFLWSMFAISLSWHGSQTGRRDWSLHRFFTACLEESFPLATLPSAALQAQASPAERVLGFARAIHL